MRQACGEAALHRAERDAFAYRCGGSTGWLDCGAGRLPVSRLTARAGGAHASTKTRASVGGGAGSVKAKRAAAARSARPRHRAWGTRGACGAGSRGSTAVLSYAPRSVLACAFPRTQLNGKQEAEARPACAVPATVRRPRAAVPPARAQAARDATALQRAGRLRSGKRPARIPADARGEPAARRTPDPRGTDGVRFPPAFARASPDPSMPCLSAGRRCAARRPLSTATTRCVPCRVR